MCSIPPDAASLHSAKRQATQQVTSASSTLSAAEQTEREARAALAQAQLFRALGEEDAARKADESAARLSGDRLSEAATSH